MGLSYKSGVFLQRKRVGPMRFQGSQGSRLKAHLCGILNLGRCVNVCFTDCLLKQDVRIEYYSLVFGKFRIVLTLSVVL